jgi:hypothetical protein
MGQLEKLRTVFDTTTEKFVTGKISEADYRKALKKIHEAGKKIDGGFLDFVDIEKLLDERKKKFSKYLSDSVVDKMTSTTWKAIKKEAGIKSSGFLKKADAGVGGKLDRYSKAHASWVLSCKKTGRGDTQLLLKANAAANDLKRGLEAFVAAKEFETDLAKELRLKCKQFIADLDREMENLAGAMVFDNDPSFMKNQINQFVLGAFDD